MIDPNNIIKYDRNQYELEELILFLICVAGKKASTVVVMLDKFLTTDVSINPFGLIRQRKAEGNLRDHLEKVKFGQYNKIEKAFVQIAESNFDLKTCSKEDLMSIHGIGRKSASCFLAWTRKGEKVAMLDTHLLKWLMLHQAFIEVTVPKSTPSSKKVYDTLENFYLSHCENIGLDPTEYDLEIWRHYSNRLDKQKKTV